MLDELMFIGVIGGLIGHLVLAYWVAPARAIAKVRKWLTSDEGATVLKNFLLNSLTDFLKESGVMEGLVLPKMKDYFMAVFTGKVGATLKGVDGAAESAQLAGILDGMDEKMQKRLKKIMPLIQMAGSLGIDLNSLGGGRAPASGGGGGGGGIAPLTL